MSYLRSGSVGPEVQALQRDLVTLGEPVEVTGVYDAATLAAIQRIQHEAYAKTTHPVDGEYSPATQALVARKVKQAKARQAAQAPQPSEQAADVEPEAPAKSEPEIPAAASPEPPAAAVEEHHDEAAEHEHTLGTVDEPHTA